MQFDRGTLSAIKIIKYVFDHIWQTERNQKVQIVENIVVVAY